MLRITAFAERLLDGLDELDWPEGIKLLQRNWIGRSQGAEIDFKIENGDQQIRVFTTRPDTVYGGTFLVLAPEHSLVDLIVTEEQWPAVREYRERAARKSELERADLSKEKTGVFTGAYAINPATNEKIPIWIADYVLLGYGTGAIGGVPAHDERDLEFAKKFDLPIVVVVQPTGDEPALGFTGEGIAINSPIINGLTSAEAKKKITAWLEERGSRQTGNQLQTARLVILASTILGRALSNCLGKRQTSRIAGKRIASRSAAARRLQTDWHRRTASGKSKRVDPLLRQGDARDEHHAAVGRLMLVLPALLRSAQ